MSTLEKAREHFTLASDAEFENRERAVESIKFRVGDQWDPEVLSARDKQKLPSIVFNQCDTLISRVANGIITDLPLLTVIPAEEDDLKASRSVHKIIKHIERISDAESIYQNTVEDAIDGGFGYFRVLTKFSDYDNEEQEIFLKHIKNRFNVYLDPSSDTDTYEDAKWGFITEVMDLKDFKEKYGKDVDHYFDGGSRGEQWDNWFFDSKVRVAEYFWREETKKTIQKVMNVLTGEIITIDADEEDPLGPGKQVIEENEVKSHKIMWGKITGDRFLEGPEEFPCDFIPIVKVIGKEENVEGKRQFYSLIENVKAPQQLLNYALTTESLLVSMQPKATWIAPEDLVEGYEDVYKNSHRENVGLLMYKRNPQFPNDKPDLLPPPKSSQGYMNLIEFAYGNIEASSGVTEAFLGRKSNETSGKAIQSRAAGSALVTSVFGKNLLKGIVHGGRIMISMIGRIFKEPDRVIRVLGKNDGFEYLQVNQLIIGDDDEPKILNDISKNKFDYVVEASSGFKTKRRENVANFMQMLQLTQNNPPMQALITSEIIRNMDVDNAVELADAIKQSSGLGQPQGSAPNAGGTEQVEARATAVTPSI